MIEVGVRFIVSMKLCMNLHYERKFYRSKTFSRNCGVILI